VRVAALYDVHGNLPALEAVLADVDAEGVDAIVAGGDVLWGPSQAECIALLRSAGAEFIRGNCERAVLERQSASAAWCNERLAPEDRELVSTWPAMLELSHGDLGRVLFCHATPRSDEENLTLTTSDEELSAALAGVHAEVVVGGHTHVQFVRQAPGSPRLVNAGSVGLPCQGKAGAYWAVLGSNTQLRRSEYDVERALAMLRESGFPRAGDFEELVTGRVRAESATAYFDTL
jgi:predicted phosphodiesterase